MKKILLFLSFLLISIGVWSADVTLFQSAIKSTSPSGGASGYASYSISSGGYSWSAYAIKNKHSNATSDKHYLQIKKYASSTAYYVSIPTMPGNISSITVTVSNTSQPMTGGGNTATLYFSSSNSTSSTGTGVVSGTGASSIALDCSSLKLKSGYITASAAIRIWELTVTYSETSAPTTYTVTYNSNGGSVMPESYTQLTEGEDITLPTPTRDGYTFTGWYTESSGGNKIGNAGDSYTPTSDITLYAQWEEIVVVEGETFELLTDINDLESGDEIIILNTDGTYALSTTQNNNNRGASNNFTISNNVVTLRDNDVQVITVGGSISAWTFDVGDGYLYAASSSANHLKTHTPNDSNGEWVITINGSYEASIVAQGSNSRNVMQFNPNNGTPIFSCYASASQAQLKIYKKQTCLPTISVTKIEQGGTFDLSSNSVCENGTVTLSNIIPSEGYKFDTIICLAQDGEEFVEHGTVNVSNSTISGITKDCYVVVIFSQLPPKPEIDVVEWNPDYIKVDINNFDAVTAVIENKNTQLNVENTAEKLFFSKYFEAAGNIKLWAVYNGTKDTIPLTSVRVLVSSNGNSWDESVSNKVTHLDTLGRIKKGYICPNEEIIVYNDGNKSGSGYLVDTAVMNCVKKSYDISSWYMINNNTTSFSGDDGLMLLSGADTLDIIGVMEPSKTGDAVIGTINNTHGDDYGWCCENGKTVHGDSTALSTNRCLLIRNNTVHSGDSAVKYNRTNFVTLCNEWVGEVVEKHEKNSPADATQTCEDFAYVGDYDYGNYYAQYTQVGENITLSSILQDDGSYKISIPDLDTLSCTLLKVIVSDNSNNSEECEYKIPIFVTENTVSNSLLFSQEGDDCPECDVVIVNGGKLTVNSTLVNRDATVYPGGVLVIPEGQTYSVNSLTLRRDNNEVPYFSYKGNLVLTDKFYIDLRTDADDWRWMTLPFAHKVSDITYQNGKKPILNSEMFLEYYDGEYRAQHKSGAWKYHNNDDVFNAGQGFLFGVDLPGKSKKIYRFSFIPDSVEHEKSDKIVKNLFAWGGNNTELAPNHKGWNMIGNPFMDNDTTDITQTIGIGFLKKDSVDGHWTGRWEVKEGTSGKLRYAVIPNRDEQFADAGYYESVVLDDYILKPLTSFFVQLGGNEEDMQTINFKATKRTNRVVAQNKYILEDNETFLRVKVDNWKTGCFISNKFTEEYEPGDDLESRYKIYQSIGRYKLLYSAINDSIIENGVKVTSPSGNLHLDEKTNTEEFEYIYALYNDDWYDLLHGETVDIESSSFILQAKRKNNGITTDISHTPTQGLYKYTDGVNIYINKNGTIFDILGSKVK